MPELPLLHHPRLTKRLSDNESSKRRQAARCYATSSATWRKLRRRVLMDEPLCRHCQAQGLVTAATEVDHKSGDSYDNTRENLQPLCKPCHSRKTARENNPAALPIKA